MPLEKLNAALIGAIQNSTPEYTNAAAILTDKLNIGREAAYRRLRGEVPFTFGEAGVLSAQMNFSLDRTVGALDFGNVLFRLSFSDYHTALEVYSGGYRPGYPFLPRGFLRRRCRTGHRRKFVSADALHALSETDQFQTFQMALPAGAHRLFGG